MRILFMGTPDFALVSLKKLYEENYEICGIVTKPDMPSGRGMKLVSTPVKLFGLEKNIPVFEPQKISKNEEFINEIRDLAPDLICVVSYGKILPKSFLEIPKYGCINVHPSMLPKYRGCAPIQWAVLNGDKTTGVTIMYLNEQMDAGDIILQKEVQIEEDETTGELWNRLSIIGADMLAQAVKEIEEGKANRISQEGEFTLAPMLEKEISKIDWENYDAFKIKNLVRGLNPIMGAYSFVNGKKIKFWKVQLVEKNLSGNAKNGEVIKSNAKEGLFIKAKDGIISVLEIQGENSKKMSINDYLRGNKIEVGEFFS